MGTLVFLSHVCEEKDEFRDKRSFCALLRPGYLLGFWFCFIETWLHVAYASLKFAI